MFCSCYKCLSASGCDLRSDSVQEHQSNRAAGDNGNKILITGISRASWTRFELQMGPGFRICLI